MKEMGEEEKERHFMKRRRKTKREREKGNKVSCRKSQLSLLIVSLGRGCQCHPFSFGGSALGPGVSDLADFPEFAKQQVFEYARELCYYKNAELSHFTNMQFSDRDRGSHSQGV